MACCPRIVKRRINSLIDGEEIELDDLLEIERLINGRYKNRRVTIQKLVDLLETIFVTIEDGSTGLFELGEVNPEGVVTAEPGQGYVNTVLKNIWIKESGSGSSGWIQYV